ncbi:glycosyltransferase [Rhodococcus sp. IEGM 1401]|uniref:glycosyltransferase n=1 Tax=unclassified Rhodococcus (in: high G+C Gram-positive bacteria) TaxID=192944 RepID=UPI0022B3A1BA|nr:MULTISPECIES: glycosyltransferase [unclassified Rhodococcus (in: high G+C Gram-positive bacteria)]MCZ4560894.1 glycosyltransferase [Rhodococcus sp. IEGM 1401]MDI9921035.1 glycosyltransferase [Rhodococcus sp. IEGM 1372]MDV8033365.1 glycosyltransferase [Rhodococcus sp. IEGM 1414]
MDSSHVHLAAGSTVGDGVLVHEWIEESGGAEKVLDAFAELFPGLPIICSWDDSPGRYPNNPVHESVIARTPLRRNKQLAMAALPLVWRMTDTSQYDWMLISSHLFAHHAGSRGRTDRRRFVYVHTPARYLWAATLDPRGQKAHVKAAAPLFRRMDKARAQAPASWAANSNFIADRMRTTWGQDAHVIYPPVDVERIQAVPNWASHVTHDESLTLAQLPADFILTAGRLVAYKRQDAAIEAAARNGLSVVVAGAGPDESRLRQLADSLGVRAVFLGRVSDEMLFALYRRALVFAFLGVEDFGIMPVEAMAAGGKVLANRVGGAAESVVDGVTGATCDIDDASDIDAALHRAVQATRASSILRARDFDKDRFKSNLLSWMGMQEVDAGAEAERRVRSMEC